MRAPIRLLTITLLASSMALPAWAQPAIVRVRGTIVSLTGDTLVISGESATTTVTLPQSAAVVGASATKMADIKPGAFIGAAAVRQPDGTQKAMEVHVFPESMRGSGEGYRPWDLGPDSTMTNGTVGKITGADGRNLTVAYAGGQQTVNVPPGVPIVTFAPGSRALLKPGASVMAFATKDANGHLLADRVTVATGGGKLAM